MKKIFNYTLLALATVIIAGLGSCTNDYSYDYRDGNYEAGPQVYFVEGSQAVSLNADQNSVDVVLRRTNAKEAVSVPITVTDPYGLFKAEPNTVNFAEGSDSAAVKLSFDFAQIQPDREYTVTVALADSTQATMYGSTSTTVTLKYAPWSAWEPFGDGKGTYVYKNCFSGNDPDLPIFYRESLIPGSTAAQFRIDNWGYGVSLYINYDKVTSICTIDEQYIGYDYQDEYPVMVMDYTSYSGTTENVSFLDAEAGKFYLFAQYYVPGVGKFTAKDYETFQCDGFYIPDYTVSFNYMGAYKDKNDATGAIISTAMGVDVASFKYVVLEGSYGADIETIASDYIDTDKLYSTEATEDGYKFIPLTVDGPYTIVSANYDENGEFVGASGLEFTFEAPGGAKWETYGMCNYTDDVVGPLFGAEPVTYLVKVQTKADKPGVYRMVNPYCAAFPYNNEGDWDDSQNWNIDIDASDPTAVSIAQQYTGCDWGYGNMFMASLAGGTLADNKITFPVKGLMVGFGDSGYYANNNGAFCLDLTPANTAKTRSAKHATLASRTINQKPFSTTKSYRQVKTKVSKMTFEQYMKVAKLSK